MDVKQKIFDLFNHKWSITNIDNMEYEAVIYRKPRFKRQDFGFSDGSSKYMNNGQQNAGAFITINHKEEINSFGFIYLKENDYNRINSVEYVSAKLCSNFVKKEGIIFTDSQNSINRYMKEMVNDKSLPYIEHVKAHSGVPYNVMVDVLSKMATNGIPEFSKEAWQFAIQNRKFIGRDLKQLLYIQSPDKINKKRLKYDQKSITEKNKKNIDEQKKVIKSKEIKDKLMEDLECYIEKLIINKNQHDKRKQEHMYNLNLDNNPIFEIFLRNNNHTVDIKDFSLEINFNNDYNFFTLKNNHQILNGCECLIDIDYKNNLINYYILDEYQKIYEIGSLCSTIVNKNELQKNLKNIALYLNQKYTDLNMYYSQKIDFSVNNAYNITKQERNKFYKNSDKTATNIVNYIMSHIYTKQEISYNLLILQEKTNYSEIQTYDNSDNVLLSYIYNKDTSNDNNIKCYMKHHPEEYLISFTVFNDNGKIDFIGIIPYFPNDNLYNMLPIIKDFLSKEYNIHDIFYLRNKKYHSWINEDIIDECGLNKEYYLNDDHYKTDPEKCDFVANLSYQMKQMIINMKPNNLVLQYYINQKEKTLQMETQSLNI